MLARRYWGELPGDVSGDWRLEVRKEAAGSAGTITEWKLNLFGDDATGERKVGWGDAGCLADDTSMWDDATFGGECYTETREEEGWVEPDSPPDDYGDEDDEDEDDEDEDGDGENVDGAAERASPPLHVAAAAAAAAAALANLVMA